MKKSITILFFILTLTFSAFSQSNTEKEKVECPTVSVIPPPSAVYPNQPMKFSVSSDEKFKNLKLTYYWNVDKGLIREGQKMSQIVVATDGLEDTLINAEVEIVGLPKGCETNFSSAGIVASSPAWCSLDEFGPVTKLDIWASIDNLFIRLEGNPEFKGIILNYGMPEDVIKREKIIKKQVKARKYDLNRLNIEYVSVEKQIRTVLWLATEESDLSKIR